MKNCIVAQSGGPTAAINASLAGVIQGAFHHKYGRIYGSPEIFHMLLPLSLGIGVGIGFIGSFTTVRKHLGV